MYVYILNIMFDMFTSSWTIEGYFWTKNINKCRIHRHNFRPGVAYQNIPIYHNTPQLLLLCFCRTCRLYIKYKWSKILCIDRLVSYIYKLFFVTRLTHDASNKALSAHLIFMRESSSVIQKTGYRAIIYEHMIDVISRRAIYIASASSVEKCAIIWVG